MKSYWNAYSPAPVCKPLHHKDVEKAAKLSGSVDAWLQWFKAFKKVLRRTNAQWPDILAKVEALKGKPVTAALEQEWAAQLDLGPMDPCKDQLHDALESYTTGSARKLVDSCGEARVLNCWRQIAHRGDSLRPAHANVLRMKAFSPPKAVPAKDLEAALAFWETDIGRYEHATGETLPLAHFRMCVEDMCPERLRNRLRGFGVEK